MEREAERGGMERKKEGEREKEGKTLLKTTSKKLIH